jgi:hypothetical protein
VFLLSAGQVASAADYSGTMNFGAHTTNATIEGSPVLLGVDLARFDLGDALSGSGYGLTLTTGQFNSTFTVPVVVFATDPNDAILSADINALAGAISTDFTSFLDSNVIGWKYYAWGNVIKPSSTTDLNNLFNSVNFVAGNHYYAFIGGGSLLTNSSLNYTLAVTAAVPEPESWAMMLAGLGLTGFVARRCSRTAA